MFGEWLEIVSQSLKMQEEQENPFGCGTYFKGVENKMRGFAWYYTYRNLFTIVKCDFVILEDINISMKANLNYISLRLDYAHHLPPGKVIAFLENNPQSQEVFIKKGTHIAYTEVVYAPEFQHKYLDVAFNEPISNPLEIIKSMGSNHNWSSKISKILVEISRSALPSMSAELFYIGKACELMSALIEMGTERLPHKLTDYKDIQKVLHYIDENFKHNIRQSDLIQLVNISPTKLKVIFKRFTNHSITEHILEKKMDYAVEMLAETEFSIDEIAKSLGFSTISGFSTSFKKQMGISPSMYRKQLQFECMNSLSYFNKINDE